MISIVAYRIAVGSFYSKISCPLSRSPVLFSAKVQMSVLLITVLSQIAMLAINLSFVVAILLVIGGIERNPGPTYKFSKIVFATSNQGDPKYCETAGLQCACNALTSACWTLYKNCSSFTKFDLDCILDYGDNLFKSLGLSRSIYVDELPNHFEINDCVFDMDCVAIETAEMKTYDWSFFKKHFKAHSSKSNAIVFFIEGYAFSLLWSKTCFVVFDSHSHDDQGLYCPDGKAVSIKFPSILQVHKYLIEKYLLSSCSVFLQFAQPLLGGESS